VNVENLKLYEPSMLDQEEEQVLSSIEDLAPDAQAELVEDTVLQKQSRTTRQGQHDLWQIGLKGQLLGKAKWYSMEKVEEKNFSPHSVNLLGTVTSSGGTLEFSFWLHHCKPKDAS
jgi:hypothetical protein